MNIIIRRFLAPALIFLIGCSVYTAMDGGTSLVVISEIKPSGGSGKTTDEYVELHNPTPRVVDISGWKVAKLTKTAQPGEYSLLIPTFPSSTFIGPYRHFLIVHHDYLGDIEPDLRYDGIGLTDDSTVVLLNSLNETVDLVGYGKALNTESSAALAPTAQFLSLERLPGAEAGNGQDTNNNSTDFIRAYPTPQNSLGVSTPAIPSVVVGEEEESEQDQPGIILEDQESAVTSTISEISVPLDFVTSTEVIDLSVSSTESLVEANVVIPPTISSTPEITSTLPEVATNTVGTYIEVPQEIIPNPGDILISEIVSSPISGEDEFVELYNRTGREIVLDAWWLEDGGGAKTILQGVIGSHGRFIIAKPKGSLNNEGDLIILGSRHGIIDQVAYGTWGDGNTTDNAPTAKSGESLIRLNEADTNNDRSDFIITGLVTKGLSNRAPEVINEVSPAVTQEIPGQTTSTLMRLRIAGVHKIVVGEVISFDAGTSSGGVGDLSFQWDFGDGNQGEGEYVEHTYKQSGSYQAILAGRDEQGSIKKKIWAVRVVAAPKKESIKQEENSAPTDYQLIKDGLVITEIYPTPSSGDVEFIELFNSSSTTVSLGGLLIDNDDGGSKPFAVPEDIKITARHYRVFTRYETGLALRPTDRVRILNQEHEEIIGKSYQNARAGFSFNFLNDAWIWSQTPTPGKVNEIIEENSKGNVLKVQGKAPTQQAGFITMAAVDDVKPGNLVTLMGIVAANPGSYATRELYLISEPEEQMTSSTRHGVRIQYKKDAPPVVVGDAVTITGKIVEKSGERHILVDSPDFVVVRKHNEVIDPQPVSISDVLKLKGGLFKIQGTITEAKKQYWYIDDETGELQIAVPKKSGQYNMGEVLDITGVLTRQNDDVILRPRDARDVQAVATSTVAAAEPIKNQSRRTWIFLMSCFGGIGIFFAARKIRKYFAKKDLVTTPV